MLVARLDESVRDISKSLNYCYEEVCHSFYRIPLKRLKLKYTCRFVAWCERCRSSV